MKSSGLVRYTLCSCAAAALLTECGVLQQAQDGTQPPIGVGASSSQTIAIAPSPAIGHRETTSSYQVLYRFPHRKDGTHTLAGLLDVKGTLYGTTTHGGAFAKGTVYSLTTTGVEKVLYSFGGTPDGAYPYEGLINVNGTLYGTTSEGGAHSNCPGGCGTVFSITPTGAEKVLYSFAGIPDGYFPYGGLIDVNGTLYGTTYDGGSGFDGGTVYSVTTTGIEKVLYNFYGGNNAISPQSGLIDVNGTLYGVTPYGGSIGYGVVYSVTTTGDEKVLHSFGGGTDGWEPYAPLIDVKGKLYGTTEYGGPSQYGTVYSISTSGAEKVLYRFTGPCGGSGGYPYAAGLINVNGTLYGTTITGPRKVSCSYRGVVYSLSLGGVEKVLHEFTGGSDGADPRASLIDVKGVLYGTTEYGGSGPHRGLGTVFALTP